jgi:hypothetical protein
MTTEIAVINRLGIALAADSAVTIPGYGGDKVFDTGDKLFELCEIHPVALMVNGSMDFLGVPWELIAKEFRSKTPANGAALSVAQWMTNFLEFVAAHPAVKPPDVQRWQEQLIQDELDELAAIVRERLEKAAAGAGQGNLQEVRLRLYREAMVERLDLLTPAPALESLADLQEDNLHPALRSLLLEQKTLPFGQDAELPALFIRLVAQRQLKDLERLTTTGLIICGFGGADMFPSLYAVEIDGYVAGRLRYQKSHDVTIDRGKETGNAISFAQTDVVDRLLKGTDNRFIDKARDFIEGNVAGSLSTGFQRSSLRIVRPDGSEVPPDEMGGLLGQLIAANFESQFVNQITQEFEKKFKDTIALMPKQDLIELAEALVSITAIERKASDDAGTVGGPIDVALITRSEGFVWIKRKHYFDPQLNPRFLWRRYSKPMEKEPAHVSSTQ